MRPPSFLICLLAGFITVRCDGSNKDDNLTREITIAEYLTNFSQEFEHYQITNQISEKFEQLLNVIKSNDVKITLDVIPNAKNTKICLTCLSATNTFLQIYEKLQIKEKKSVIKLAQDICHLYSMKKYVCDGLIDLNADMILYSLEHLKTLPTASRVCEIAFQGENCIVSVNNIFDDHYAKVELSISKNVLQTSKKSSTHSNEDPLVILHLTDIHFDPEYVVGVNAACGSEACCRHVPDLGPADHVNAAGYWGDYRDCDTPWHAVQDVVDHIRLQHPRIDAIYFTGDIIHHFTWNTTQETNKESMRQIFRLLKESFPGIPLYPILGNHEAHPANLYAPHDVPESLNSKYLYDYIMKEWSDWIQDSTANTTIADGGYYTVLSSFGYRIISLNNNFCFVHNWWLLFNDDYFIQQLQWLHDTLLAAENAGEKVHILAHVPSYDNYCYIGWTREYRKIVERFGHIIEGQFNGHSHVDEFNVFYKKDDPSVAVNVAWNGGSTTTFTRLNPNYKVFYADRENYEILDHETWIYNLTEANLHPDRKPKWIKEYSFKELFALDDLSPNSLDALLQRFAQTEADLIQFWKLKQKNADPMLIHGCDESCLRDTLCAITRTEYADDSACERLLMTIKSNV
ncbi:sphingomyelin phosphodiesterase 1-like [Malaya genurostris]|uniref:sphingomyelin phosphodiesterase 1-like n=1 Tax=Malaya genurostris TaxID=325434 RepID=UPI0026F3BF78|nr:sphingomyelin phosphodiesterase 1-like [Malaya genurostris]